MRVPPWAWPAAAAAIALAAGFEPLRAAAFAVAAQWNVLLFILGLMCFSAAAEESGAFAWVTSVVLARARGSRRRLFVWLFATGALITIVLSNDATAVGMTPIVYRAVARRGGDASPYLYACAFVANTASFGLPFSNPANVLVLGRPDLGAYLLHLGPPQIVAVALNLIVLVWMFGSRLDGRYEVEPVEPLRPAAARTLWVLGALAVAYAVASLEGWPLGIVAAVAAACALVAGRVSPSVAVRHVSWGTMVLLAALFVVLDAFARAGLFADALHATERAAVFGYPAASAIAVAAAALAANAANNLPVAAIGAYVAAHPPTAYLGFPIVAGVDLGPNLTANGSLATVLWLAVLERRQPVGVSKREFTRLGLLVVPATLLPVLIWLWVLGG